MVDRTLKRYLEDACKHYPVVAVLGPRQSGKTTLVRAVFPNHTYINLEDVVGVQEYIKRDPMGFLEEHRNPFGIIIDEFQHAPLLLSYIQLAADEEKRPGYFILTGSQNFLMNEAITQSLAGRIALLTLLPFSLEELKRADLLQKQPEEAIYKGFYPRLYSDGVEPTNYYKNYVRTYIERDVRQLKNIENLSKFQTFMQLCAGRTGQTLVETSLANDCGITVSTVRSWLSVLEATYVIFLLRPHHNNLGKRLVKAPKLYFYDTGLASFLLNIETPEQVVSHYLRGGLFESMIIADVMKYYAHHDKVPRVYFWKDKTGHEIDCLIEWKNEQIPIEIKSGKTLVIDYFDSLMYWKKHANINPSAGYVIYGGKEMTQKTMGTALGWDAVDQVFKA